MDNQELIKAIQDLKPTKDWWDYAASGIVTLTSVLTLIVALKLFKRFSFRRQILQKQLDTVFQLITVLQNWTIYIGAKGLKKEDDTTSFQYGFRVKFFDFRFDKTDPNFKDLFFKEKLLFTYDWEEQNPLKGWDNNPFLPSKIAEKLEWFKITFPYPAYETDFKKVVYIDLDQFDKSVHRQERKRTNYIYNPDDYCCKNFETFHKICNDLINEIENWLDKYQANDLNMK